MWRTILQNTWPVLLKNIKNKDAKKKKKKNAADL